MSTERLEKLINQCKSNDVDQKVDAVTKLQAEFESGIEIADAEPVISALKACLRISNQHLTTATLSALPPLLPLIVARNNVVPNANAYPLSASSSTSSAAGASHDLMVLRQVMNAFLPAPGVFERLGDSREKARDKARETLVILGGLAFRAPSSVSKMKDTKGHEPSIAIFERFLRDSGFGSKVARVREQSLLVLVHIRRTHHLFPLRPYLSLLVDILEDTDGSVRACATPSVIELFTGPGVTDAARSDLKKEMAKKGVRKAIVDNIQSHLMNPSRATGASTPQSEGSGGSGEPSTKKDYIPPSLMLQQNRRPTVGASSGFAPARITRAASQGNVKENPRPASRAAVASPPLSQHSSEAASTVEPAFIASARDLENEFLAFAKSFEGKETEHNWAARERAIQRVRGMLSGNIHTRYPDIFLQCLKDGFMQSSVKTLISLRTTVAGTTCSLYTELAVALGSGIDPFCEMLYTNLLRMAGYTKKITAQQSQQTLSVIMQHASAHPRSLLPLLWNTLQEKTVQSRTYALSHITQYIQVHGTRARSHIESAGGLEILEKSLKKALADPNPAVRETARGAFWAFEGVWHDWATMILESLDPTARKQLEKACPNPEAIANLPLTIPTTPSAKKSSVAAAIAASRAKAKAIATAPPTLRHQATSSSHATRATSPPVRRSVSPISPTTKISNGRSSPSPASKSSLSPRSSLSPLTPPRSRILSGTMPRSVSSGAPMTSHSRSSTDTSLSSSSPEANRRRESSPLAPSISPHHPSTVRKTVQQPPYDESATLRHIAPPVPAVAFPVRHSTIMPDINGQESLLLATVIPIPDDSDSEMDDESVNLMSFSTPYKVYPPVPSLQASFSPSSDRSTPFTTSNALSNGSSRKPSGSAPVEDALRARAEQAQSAAERLLELNDPDGEDNQHSTIPPSLLLGSGIATPKPKVPNTSAIRSLAPPVTPDNRNTAIFRQAALFKNSPANTKAAESLLKPVQDQVHETGWWLKRMSTLDHATPLKTAAVGDRVQELNDYITALESDQTDIRVLQKLALLCSSNPIPSESTSPLSPGLGLPSSVSPFLGTSRSLLPLIPDIWTKDKSFERLFNALVKFLEPSRGVEQLEYGLIVLWELLSNQAPFVEGREADIFATLFTARYCDAIDVLEATKTIRDALATRIEPVYGLTTMHASLRAFMAEPSPDESSKDASHAFGLIALAKFVMRLPSEVLEEELPRLKATLMAALNDATLVVREAAYATIIAAQLVLRDETHLFALLDGLDDNKKNLLTYYFDKHDARDLGADGGVGMTKLEGQMGRLDKLMNTPRKGRASE